MPELIKISKIFFIWKIAICLFMLWAFGSGYVHKNKWNLYYSKTNKSLMQTFSHWDGQHYLKLAQEGYPPKVSLRSAFYPLFPLVIKITSLIIPNLYAAALLSVTLCSFFFFVFFITKLLSIGMEMIWPF